MMWELPNGELVDGLQQHRMSVVEGWGRWDVYAEFIPGRTRIWAVYLPYARNGKVLPVRDVVFESSLALPTLMERAEADAVLSQVCVDWFGPNVMAADARAMFGPFEPTEHE